MRGVSAGEEWEVVRKVLAERMGVPLDGGSEGPVRECGGGGREHGVSCTGQKQRHYSIAKDKGFAKAQAIDLAGALRDSSDGHKQLLEIHEEVIRAARIEKPCQPVDLACSKFVRDALAGRTTQPRESIRRLRLPYRRTVLSIGLRQETIDKSESNTIE